MSASGAEEPPLGERLLALGWRQGCVFGANSIAFLWNEHSTEGGRPVIHHTIRKLRSRERLVLATQDCDIEAAAAVEPYVEALICKLERDQGYLAQIDRNSARIFVIDRVAGLVAQAKYRVQIDKRALTELTPEPWPSTPDRLVRFARWLARRYDRPAFPDRMVQDFERPVVTALDLLRQNSPSIHAAFNRGVYEIRVNMPASEEPPFDLRVSLLLHAEALSLEEADALESVREAIRSCLNPALVRLDPDIRALTPDDMTLAEYLATRPIFLEYHTYQGEEIEGAEPPSHT